MNSTTGTKTSLKNEKISSNQSKSTIEQENPLKLLTMSLSESNNSTSFLGDKETQSTNKESEQIIIENTENTKNTNNNSQKINNTENLRDKNETVLSVDVETTQPETTTVERNNNSCSYISQNSSDYQPTKFHSYKNSLSNSSISDEKIIVQLKPKLDKDIQEQEKEQGKPSNFYDYTDTERELLNESLMSSTRHNSTMQKQVGLHKSGNLVSGRKVDWSGFKQRHDSILSNILSASSTNVKQENTSSPADLNQPEGIRKTKTSNTDISKPTNNSHTTTVDSIQMNQHQDLR